LPCHFLVRKNGIKTQRILCATRAQTTHFAPDGGRPETARAGKRRRVASPNYLPFSFVIVSLGVELEVDAVVDELGGAGDVELDDADELGVVGDDVLDDAVELGVDDDVSVVVEDELLVDGGVAGIDGVVVELDELLLGGGVVTGVSTFCWQPTRAITAAAAAVRMKRFI
jgi:hypothetical protein